jgi:hypothetical protein
MVITQEPAQSLAALHGPGAADACIAGKQQDVVLPLMIALSMVMLDVFAQGAPQGALAKGLPWTSQRPLCVPKTLSGLMT